MRTHILTIAGWSPGVRALARGQPLTCGCLVGVYRTWSENVVALIDAVGDHCRQHHDINLVLWRQQLREDGLEVSPRWISASGSMACSRQAAKRAVTEQRDVRTALRRTSAVTARNPQYSGGCP